MVSCICDSRAMTEGAFFFFFFHLGKRLENRDDFSQEPNRESDRVL